MLIVSLREPSWAARRLEVATMNRFTTSQPKSAEAGRDEKAVANAHGANEVLTIESSSKTSVRVCFTNIFRGTRG